MFELCKFQELIVSSEILFPGTSTFNIGGYVKVPRHLNHNVFEQTLGFMAKELPALSVQLIRACDNQKFRQIISEASCFENRKIVKVSCDDAAIVLMHQELVIPFVIENNTLYDMQLFESSSGNCFIFLKMHHIIGDGFSIKIIAEYFFRRYITIISNDKNETSVKNWLIPHYLAAEKSYLASSQALRAAHFWNTRLSILPDGRGFETLFDKAPTHCLTYKRYTYTLTQDLLERTKEFSRKNDNLSVFSLLLSVIYILNHICGNDDFVAGLSVLIRPGINFKNSIGPFMNIIPFFFPVNGRQSFFETAVKVAKTLKENYRFRKLPLLSIVEKLNRKTRLYNIGVSFQDFKYELNFDGIQSELCFMENNSQQEDLVFHMMHDRQSGGLQLMIDAKCDLFSEKQVNFIGNRFISLLDECLTNPDTVVSNLEPATSIEREYVFTVLNNTYRKFPEKCTVITSIDEQIIAIPRATAVIATDAILSYEELGQKSKRLASWLIHYTAEKVVGVFMDRSSALVIALHGIMRAGKAYVPISTDFPMSRVRCIQQDAQFNVVLVDLANCELIEKYLPDSKKLIVDFDLHHLSLNKNVILQTVKPEDWAYVIYTSGTSGEPKGVINTHRSLYNRLQWQQREIPIEKNDVVLQKTPYTFDVSVWEFFWPFMNGGSLCVLAPGAHKDARQILAAIRDYRVTVIHFVPSMLRLFLEVIKYPDVGSLHTVIVSGEELHPELQECFFSRCNAKLYNLYGPTEAAIDVSFWPCQKYYSSSTIPIGYPIDNTQLLILNPYGKLMPSSTRGEIHIAGYNVGLGYLKKPRLTAEKFVPNLFGGGLLYKTGDLGKWCVNGYIDYCGRIDGQVKLHGLRIELGEIDAQLNALASVQVAKTIIRENKVGKCLVSFCVFVLDSPESNGLLEQAKKHLQEKLPSYMLPSAIIPIDAIPLSSSGKVDIKKLCELPLPLIKNEYVAPANSAEQEMAELMASVLGIDKVGVTDNFFALGGSSLQAISFVNKCERITLQEFYAKPCVRDLVTYHQHHQTQTLVQFDTVGVRKERDTLIIFVPYGGGSGFIYQELVDEMLRIDVAANMLAVEVERNHPNLEAVAESIFVEMKKNGLLTMHKRFFIYGHCVGSALAMAIGIKLQSCGVHIESFVAGGYIAGLPYPFSFIEKKMQLFIHRKNLRIAKLMKWVGFRTSENIDPIEHEALFNHFRTDGYRARQFYARRLEKRLDTNIYLILGEHDPLTRYSKVFKNGWRRYVSGSVTVLNIPNASHYFVHYEVKELAGLLLNIINLPNSVLHDS